MKVEGMFKTEPIPRFRDLKSGECFIMYGAEGLFMKTDEGGAVNLSNGELAAFVNPNEPIVLVNASVKTGGSDNFDTIKTDSGCKIKYFYRYIYNNHSVAIPKEIFKHLKISKNDKLKIAVRGSEIVITKNTAAE